MIDFARRKKFAWVALATGVGGTLAFVLLCAMERMPGWRDVLLFIWPISTVAMTAIAALLLKIYYRQEPESAPGFWQLSITDLIAISFFAALLMSAWRSVWPHSFLRAGIAICLVLAAAFTFCLLLATLRGFKRTLPKIIHALNLLLTTLGWMSIGTVVVIALVILFYDQMLHELTTFLADVFWFENNWEGNGDYLTHPLRVGWLCLPLGFALKQLSRFLVSRQK